MRKLILAAAVMLAACDGGADFSNSTGPVTQPVTTGKADFALAAGKPTLLHVSSATVTEGQTAPVTISVSGGNGKPISVQWTDGARTETVTVSTKAPASILEYTRDDSDVNGTRTVTINAKAVSGTTGVGASGTVTILDNDVAPAPAPQPAPTQTCPDGSVIPLTNVCPAPPPAPTGGDILSPSLSGFAPIASNFDTSKEYDVTNVPQSNAPDTLGAFRFICNAAQILPDDPIVFPGQPGRSHLHQFYGNTAANAYSTYQSLRTTGQSTCMSPLNRSAYWMPAMLDGKGNVVVPDYVQVYYKRYPVNSWQCTDGRAGKACVQQPNGLRWIEGRNMADLSQPSTGNPHFLCDNDTGSWPTLQQALKVCTAGHHILAGIGGPPCWDGKRLDSANHRDHVAYMVDSHMGYFVCPADHPYIIPEFQLAAAYLVVAGEDTSGWHFASDEMVPGEPAGSTYHVDLFDAWDQDAKTAWTDNCIGKLLNCSAGLLGDGRALHMYSGFSWTAKPRLVPVPPRP
jgi:hypothetical protein